MSENVEPRALKEQLMSRLGGRPEEIMVVSPATTSLLKLAAGDVDDAIAAARQRLDRVVSEIARDGLRVLGEVGDSDPRTAINDALMKFDADEIVIVTAPEDKAGWLEKEALEAVRGDLPKPVTHLVALGDDNIVEAERTPPGVERSDEGLDAYGLPRMPARNVAAIVIGVAGTVVLWILAGGCYGDISHEGMDAGCAVRIGLAWAALVVTALHLVALLLFRAACYRGTWERLVAWTLILAIAPAIVVSLLVG